MEIKDSGRRREFETGAVRDMQEGKGRCDLLPLFQISRLLGDEVIAGLYLLQMSDTIPKRSSAVKCVFESFCALRGWNEYEAVLEAAKQYEAGALKYGARNWEKGIPTHSYIDSAIRHYLKYRAGMEDEPHDRAFLFNLFGYIWTIRNKPELDDFYYCKDESKAGGNGGVGCQVIYCDGGSSTSSETMKKSE